MNCDNKFGQCCSCPAITNLPREMTQYSNSKLYELEMMKKMGLTNSHDYRHSLQNNANNLMKETINTLNNNYRCKNSNNNKFYLDSTNYNTYYDVQHNTVDK